MRIATELREIAYLRKCAVKITDEAAGDAAIVLDGSVLQGQRKSLDLLFENLSEG
jgi:hypothetical protein